MVQAAANDPATATVGQKRSATKDAAAPPAGKKRRAPEAKTGSKVSSSQARGRNRADCQSKKGAKADSPSADDADLPPLTPGAAVPQTLASPEEIAFFDKVKKHVDDKVSYHEFLKLINLFTQDMIDTRTLVERAESFIGGAGDVWITFKKMVQVDEAGNPPPNPHSAQGGHGFGGMVNIDGQTVDMVPMLERVKPDLNGPRVKTYGPSYRKLPKTVSCSQLAVWPLADQIGDQYDVYRPRRHVLGSPQRRMGLAPHLGGRGLGTFPRAQKEHL
jgi:paired amphipathic helix protein Sin3a